MRTFPPELKTDVVREEMVEFVHLITWKPSGESFEFAHFTDRELARAIERLDRRRVRKPGLDRLITAMRGIRAARGNLDDVLEDAKASKPELADALWPTLERKIERAIARGTAPNIPAVRVLHAAVNLAHEYPRRNLALALTPRPRR